MKSNMRILALPFAIALGACYQQQPLSAPAPAPATHVVAQLTDSGTVVMGNALGEGVMQVEGIVTNADENNWTMQMLRVEQRGERTIEWNREPVTFPSNVLTNRMMVTLDKKRSYIAAGGILAGAFVLARVFNIVGANDSEEEQPQPQHIFILGGRK